MDIGVFLTRIDGEEGRTHIREFADGSVSIVVWIDAERGNSQTLAHELVHCVQALAGMEVDEGIAEVWGNMLHTRYKGEFSARLAELLETEETKFRVSAALVREYRAIWGKTK